MAKPHAIFQSFLLLEMLSFIHSSMTGNFNPNLSRGSETSTYIDLNSPNGILHVFSLTKLLPVSILEFN